ncbi:MAG TPA: hypothetical protein VGK67_12940 [Myxococcales bacterium]|jgi:hypothetical protein
MLKRTLARLLVSRQRDHGFSLAELESKHVDRSKPNTNDSSCFYGGDEAGNAGIFRLAFRGSRMPECWLDVRLAKEQGGLRFGLPANPGPERDGHVLGDVSFTCEEPGKRWRIRYGGPLTDAAGNLASGEVDLLFSATHPIFDYAQSTDRRMVAEALARERWSRSFFEKVRELGQVHYEQFGKLQGTARFGETAVRLDLLTTRDHSFGSRVWAGWDRHYFLSGMTPAGEGFTVIAVRYDFCGPIYAGFTCAPDGSHDPIVHCTPLEEVARERAWPENGSVELRTRSGQRHTLEFRRDGHFPYVGDGTYLMKEGIGRFRFDGKDAFGLCEFGFDKAKYEKAIAEPSSAEPHPSVLQGGPEEARRSLS